ncbi:hypothetical protein AWB74_07588 [Caballeronia arvi]|uniref:Uncharacterized protein n=1 Tax=Caballeronia arvi TaxID=1777135 RepID=A0A158KZI0_9BURK|nr:hypothetical protein AWB74_07588 [Caballeronia arvi]
MLARQHEAFEEHRCLFFRLVLKRRWVQIEVRTPGGPSETYGFDTRCLADCIDARAPSLDVIYKWTQAVKDCFQTNAVTYDQREAEKHTRSETPEGNRTPSNNVYVGGPNHDGRRKPDAGADAQTRECHTYAASFAK